MEKTHRQRAGANRRKRWIKQCSRTGTGRPMSVVSLEAEQNVPTLDFAEMCATEAVLPSSPLEHYTIMVRFAGKRAAVRLADDGGTTNRKARSVKLSSREEAERSARAFERTSDGFQRVWVARY